MPDFNLHQATGLSPEELSEVFQRNPRAYMAVRGAVAEKHLEKVVVELVHDGVIQSYRMASGDMDKDFYLDVDGSVVSLECKNVEVIKTSTKAAKLAYIRYLLDEGLITQEFLDSASRKTQQEEVELEELPATQLSLVFNELPQALRESGIAKYRFSASQVASPALGTLNDYEYVNQFNRFPITIDFQRTRNSTDEEGDTRRNRYYRAGEIDIVAACMFSRTMEWKFLFAKTVNFDRHHQYTERYNNRVRLEAGEWTSDITAALAP